MLRQATQREHACFKLPRFLSCLRSRLINDATGNILDKRSNSCVVPQLKVELYFGKEKKITASFIYLFITSYTSYEMPHNTDAALIFTSELSLNF